LVDDLDGSTENVAPVQFSLDGCHMEIDLSDVHAARLRAVLCEYVRGGARWVGGRRLRPQHAAAVEPVSTRPRKGSHAKASAKRDPIPEPAQMRTWAAEQGLPVSDRGRIPDAIKMRFREAHS
jgi:hypothetical protein